MFKLLRFFKKSDWLIVACILALTIGQVVLELLLPEYLGDMVVLATSNADSSMIWQRGLLMLLFALGIIACAMLIGYCSTTLSNRFAKTLRTQIFNKVNSFSLHEMNKFSVPSLITRTSNDMFQVLQVIMMTMRIGIMSPIMAIGAICKVINMDLSLSIATAVGIVVLVALIMIIFYIAVPKFIILQQKLDKINAVTRESVTGIRVIRANNAENKQSNKFDKVNKELTQTQLFINRVTSALEPGMSLIINLLVVVGVYISSFIISRDPVFVGQMTSFTVYIRIILFSFVLVSMLFVNIPRGKVSAKRINEVLDTKNEIVDGTLDLSIIPDSQKKVGEVVFNHVSFKYPDAKEYILKDITFTATAGQTVAIIGSTGSGKSTLINLIARMYDATDGEVLVDGYNVKDYKLHDLNDKLGFVPQKGFLFSGDVYSNVTFGVQNASDEEVERALKIAKADFVYKEFEDTIHHPIAQGGTNVSGGQRQRISIARAVIKNPEIYIFDDSFSALDYKTDKALRANLARETKNATKFIVSQRIGTIMNADTIIVLEEGNMVGIGTHAELMKKCKVYKEIAYSQLSKEELEVSK